MIVHIDATDDRILDSYKLVVATAYGSADTQFRVIPQQRPLWDVMTPGAPARGTTEPSRSYVLQIGGFNLGQASLVAEEPGKIELSNLSYEENGINGVLEVRAGAAFGYTYLRLDGPGGCTPPYYSYCRIPIQIVPPGTGAGREDNVTAGLADREVPALYLAKESFAMREGPGLAHGDSDTAGFRQVCRLPYRRLFSLNLQRSFVFCRGLGSFSQQCLQGLRLGQTADLGSFVLSIFFEVDFTIAWWGRAFCLPVSYTVLCFKVVAGAEVPGCCGVWASADWCFGQRELLNPQVGQTNSLTYEPNGCLEITAQDPAVVGGVRNATVRLNSCCPSSITIAASGDTFRNTRFARPFSLREPAAVGTPSASCPEARVGIDTESYPNILFADGTTTTLAKARTTSPSGEPVPGVTVGFSTTFGTIDPESTTDAIGEAYSVYTSGQLALGSTSTTSAIVRASIGGITQLAQAKVYNYRGVRFEQLTITDQQVEGITMTQEVIQSFFEGVNPRGHRSFLARFIMTGMGAKCDGFMDQGDGERDPDAPFYSPTGDTDFFDCGQRIRASQLFLDIATDQQINPKILLATAQKEHQLLSTQTLPNRATLNLAMECYDGTRDFISQIRCAANTFKRRFTESRSLRYPLFVPLRVSDQERICIDLRDISTVGQNICHNIGDTPPAHGKRVSFSIQNAATRTQYRYTPWIQSLPNGGGVVVFDQIWRQYQFDRD